LIRSDTGDVIGQGTGFLVTGGKVVTNEHVVRRGRVFVDLGRVKLPTTIERTDQFNDLALLTVSGELASTPLTVSADVPTPGTAVFAIGNPAGLENTISTGVVSGLREFDGRQLLQITAPISPGSSGGPILNAHGEVLGVAVGAMTRGQNLNFAVPAAHLRRLLAGNSVPTTDVTSLLVRAQELSDQIEHSEYDADPASQWQKDHRELAVVLETALARAGRDSELLIKVSEAAGLRNLDTAVAAAERAVQATPSVAGHLLLAEHLQWKANFGADAEAPMLRTRAEHAARAALRLSKHPNADVHYRLGDVLEDRESYVEAEAHYLRAFELNRASSDSDRQVAILRGLVRTSRQLGKARESTTWFRALVDSGKANAWDWQQNGRRLDEDKQYREAGESYRKAALLGSGWSNWCEAAGSFSVAGGEEDAVLDCARRCVTGGTGKPKGEEHVAIAHRQIADVLNQRGVYQEALSHARESIALNSTDPWAFDTQADALNGLRRFREAITASSEAVRLSDGKFATMHFTLASAYYNSENWVLARQSFQKAAELSPNDDSAAYNVALCLVRMEYFRDAASWYEEALRRNPTRRDRQELLARIEALRR
jgi:tetratricopeptide (TPR) repeat protein